MEISVFLSIRSNAAPAAGSGPVQPEGGFFVQRRRSRGHPADRGSDAQGGCRQAAVRALDRAAGQGGPAAAGPGGRRSRPHFWTTAAAVGSKMCHAPLCPSCLDTKK